MELLEVIWKDQFVEKIKTKHRVHPEEVEEILFGSPHIRRSRKGLIKGEDVYTAHGQTVGGRYLIVLFIRKERSAALPISARDMTDSERTYYERQAEAD